MSNSVDNYSPIQQADRKSLTKNTTILQSFPELLDTLGSVLFILNSWLRILHSNGFVKNLFVTYLGKIIQKIVRFSFANLSSIFEITT